MSGHSNDAAKGSAKKKGPAFLEMLYGNEHVSTRLWNTTFAFIGVGVAFAGSGIYCMLSNAGLPFKVFACVIALLGLLMAAFGFALPALGLKDIPANPIHVGILTFWGRRLKVVVTEGMKLLAPFFPFFLDVILVNAEQRSFTTTLEDVPCLNAVDADGKPVRDTKKKAVGGMVHAQVSGTLGPDYKAKDKHGNSRGGERVINWLNRGSREEIEKILAAQIDEGFRHLAGRFDWETFVFMKAPLTVALLSKVADIDFKLLPRNEDGTFAMEPTKITPEQYHKLDDIEHHPLDYLLEENLTEKEQARRLVEIETFLSIARQNGVSDIVDLGAHISRLNINWIVPTDDLKESTAEREREKQERQRDNWDTETGIQLAEQFMTFVKKHDGQMDPMEALRLSRVDRKRSSESTVLTPDAKDPITKGAAVFAGATSKQL